MRGNKTEQLNKLKEIQELCLYQKTGIDTEHLLTRALLEDITQILYYYIEDSMVENPQASKNLDKSKDKPTNKPTIQNVEVNVFESLKANYEKKFGLLNKEIQDMKKFNEKNIKDIKQQIENNFKTLNKKIQQKPTTILQNQPQVIQQPQNQQNQQNQQNKQQEQVEQDPNIQQINNKIQCLNVFITKLAPSTAKWFDPYDGHFQYLQFTYDSVYSSYEDGIVDVCGRDFIQDYYKLSVKLIKIKEFIKIGVYDEMTNRYYAYENDGEYFAGSSQSKAQGKGFKAGEILTMQINTKTGQMIWKVGEQIRFKAKNKQFENKQVKWKPFVSLQAKNEDRIQITDYTKY